MATFQIRCSASHLQINHLVKHRKTIFLNHIFRLGFNIKKITSICSLKRFLKGRTQSEFRKINSCSCLSLHFFIGVICMYISDFQSVIPGAAALLLHRDMSEVQIFGLQHRPAESETRKMRSSTMHFNKPSRKFWCSLSLRTTEPDCFMFCRIIQYYVAKFWWNRARRRLYFHCDYYKWSENCLYGRCVPGKEKPLCCFFPHSYKRINYFLFFLENQIRFPGMPRIHTDRAMLNLVV